MKHLKKFNESSKEYFFQITESDICQALQIENPYTNSLSPQSTMEAISILRYNHPSRIHKGTKKTEMLDTFLKDDSVRIADTIWEMKGDMKKELGECGLPWKQDFNFVKFSKKYIKYKGVMFFPDISLFIAKFPDEWYYVVFEKSHKEPENRNFYYKCDQIDGLIELLEEKLYFMQYKCKIT